MKNVFLVFVFILLAACGARDERVHTAKGDHAAHGDGSQAEEIKKGSHGGRLLADGEFAVEIVIFETGVPPEFHVYPSRGGKAIDPAAVKVNIELTRLGGNVTRFDFVRENDYLKATAPVVEPHSFDVKVTADYAGKQHAWAYATYEGRTTIAADIAAAAGIKTAVAGAGTLRETLKVYGSVRPDPQRVRTISARFPGPIRAVHKQIGDMVKAGEVLAVIESNESLQTYAVTSPIGGVVIERRANAGETAGSEPLFVVADYSRVSAELNLFARDRHKVKAGQSVLIAATDGDLRAEGKIDFIASGDGDRHQALLVRVPLDNRELHWTPGLYVGGEITIGTTPVPLVVANSALQTFRDFTVVYAQVNDTYEVRMLELGISDGEFTEVRSGLDVGTRYVIDNSYLIKADIEKSGASHDH